MGDGEHGMGPLRSCEGAADVAWQIHLTIPGLAVAVCSLTARSNQVFDTKAGPHIISFLE